MITHIDRPTKQKISTLWDKPSNEDLQRYSELVNCRLHNFSLPNDILNPFVTTTNMIWILILSKVIWDCLVKSANEYSW